MDNNTFSTQFFVSAFLSDGPVTLAKCLVDLYLCPIELRTRVLGIRFSLKVHIILLNFIEDKGSLSHNSQKMISDSNLLVDYD
jgi:hypothetical protein